MTANNTNNIIIIILLVIKSIADIFKGMVTDDEGKQKPGIFVDKAQANSAKFTAPVNKDKPAGGHKYTMTEVMRMKNENPDLDIDSYINAWRHCTNQQTAIR